MPVTQQTKDKPYRSEKADPEPKPLNREQSLQGIFQLVAGVTAFVAPADAAAIVVHSPPICKAAAETAANDPKFAALLDRITTVGPYGALMTTIMPLVVQILANHNMIPESMAKQMGARTKDELLLAMLPEEMQEEALKAQGENGQYAAQPHNVQS